MALPFEVEKIDDIPEPQRTLYIEKDGKFRLDITGIDPADELKRALAAEREQSRQAKTQLAEQQRLREEAERKKLEENKQYEDLWKKEREDRLKIAADFETSRRESHADLLVQQLSNDPVKADILRGKMLGNIQFADGKISITGLPGIGTSEELVAHFREKYPFLVDGSKASGGGAPGGTGGGMPVAKTMTRVAFEGLNSTAKMNFHREGGRLID